MFVELSKQAAKLPLNTVQVLQPPGEPPCGPLCVQSPAVCTLCNKHVVLLIPLLSFLVAHVIIVAIAVQCVSEALVSGFSTLRTHAPYGSVGYW